MKRYYLMLVLCYPLLLFSQHQSKIDSLENELIRVKKDTDKAFIISSIFDELLVFDLEKAKSYRDMQFELAENTQDDYIFSAAYATKGNYYLFIRDFDSAAICMKKAIRYAEKAGNPKMITKTYFSLGNIYRWMNRKDSTLIYLDKAIEISEKNADYVSFANIHVEKGYYFFGQSQLEEALKNYHIADSVLSKIDNKGTDLVTVLNALCGIHKTIEDYDKAEEYCLRAKKISEEIGQMAYMMTAERGLGEIDWLRKDYVSAAEKFNKVLDYFVSINNTFAECRMLRLLGKVNTDQREFEKAEANLLKGLAIARKIPDSTTILLIGEDLGYLYLQDKNYTESLKYYTEALNISRKLSNLENEVNSLKYLAEINYLTQHHQKASEFYRAYVPLKDSLNNTINVEKVTEIETRYQTVQKEQQIELLSTENQLAEQKRKNQFTFFGVTTVLMAVVGFALLFAYRNKLKTAQKIKELNELRSRFFTNISHEFRTPLTLIKSPLQRLQAQLSDEKQQSHLSLIDKNADRMLELVDQLLELSKLDSGHLKLMLKEGNIGLFLKSIVEPFAYQAIESGFNYSSDIEVPSGNHRYDKDVVEKIVTNLLSNALKYTPEGQRISVRSVVENEELNINISNSVRGMQKSDLPKIFERFYQNEDGQEGFGVGLALVKELVELYEGKINTSLANQVLSFKITLPLVQNSAENMVMPIEAGNGVREVHHVETEFDNAFPVLLIVDDNSEIRNLLKDIFSESYTILEAENGKAALKIAQKEIPDCIISDVMMPEMDGFRFTQAIKDNELASFIPVVLLTAKSSDEAHLEGLKSTADAYLTKPFHNEILKETVVRQISERKKLRERYSRELILKPLDIAINTVDEKFLEKLGVVMEKYLSDTNFSTDDFASELGISRMQLHRKLKSLLNVSTTEFIRNERLKSAVELFRKGHNNVSEVAYTVGFNDVSYFSKCFKELYSVTPSEYIHKVDA